MKRNGLHPITISGKQVFTEPHSGHYYRLSFEEAFLIIESAENKNDALQNRYEDSVFIPYISLRWNEKEQHSSERNFMNIFEMLIVMFYKYKSVHSDFASAGWIKTITPDLRIYEYTLGNTLCTITFDEIRGVFICEFECAGINTTREYTFSESGMISPQLCEVIAHIKKE